MSDKRKPGIIEKTIAVALLLLLVFASPILDWWSRSGLHWFTPYLFWLGIIILTAFIHSNIDNNDF